MFNTVRTLESTASSQAYDSGRLREFAGNADSALIFGGIPTHFGTVLDSLSARVTAIAENEIAADEARVFSSDVHVCALTGSNLRKVAGPTRYDVVLVADALAVAANPRKLFRDLRSILSPKGRVLALFANVSHGAIRLGFLKGAVALHRDSPISVQSYYALDEIEDILLDSGFVLGAVDRIRQPIFAQVDGLPPLSEDDFPQSVLDVIAADPESLTFQFLIKADQVDESAKGRVLTRRLYRTDSELTAAQATLEKQRADLAHVQTALAASDARIGALERVVGQHEQTTSSQTLPDVICQALAQATTTSNIVLLGLELDSLRERNAELERSLHDANSGAVLAPEEADAMSASLASSERQLAEVERLMTAAASELHRQAGENERALRGTVTELEQKRAELEQAIAEAGWRIEQLNLQLSQRMEAEQALQSTVAQLEDEKSGLEQASSVAAQRIEELDSQLSQTMEAERALQSTVAQLEAKAAGVEQAAAAATQRSEELDLQLSQRMESERALQGTVAQLEAKGAGLEEAAAAATRRSEELDLQLSQALGEWETTLIELAAAHSDKQVMETLLREARERNAETTNALRAAVREKESFVARERLAQAELARMRRESDDLRQAYILEQARALRSESDVQNGRELTNVLSAQLEEHRQQLLALTSAYRTLEERYAEQTQTLIDRSNEQVHEIVNFTNAIQSGKFWKLKKIAGKLMWLLRA